jgi:2-C-methyl-D-erythritol 4-phosphate cytidylyltransferase
MIEDLGIVVAAGGSSSRYGEKNKLFEELCGLPVFAHSIENFMAICPLGNIVLTAPEKDLPEFSRLLEKNLPDAKIKIVCGGDTRMKSVINGLDALPDGIKIVAVHDAARPLASSELLKKCYEACLEHGASVASKPVTDTIKTADENCFSTGTLDRSTLWAMETPQVFPLEALRNACEMATEKGMDFTDDAGVMEFAGHPVYLLNNPDFNIKITYKGDIPLAESAL